MSLRVIMYLMCRSTVSLITLKQVFKRVRSIAGIQNIYLPRVGPLEALPANLKFIHWYLRLRKNL